MCARSIRLCVVLLSALLCGAAQAQTLYTFPDATFSPVYAFLNSATKSLDMTMYELVDTTAQADLAALAKRGVKVRVILDQNLERANNTPAFTFLNANGVTAVWANHAYSATHQKTITVDGSRSLILSANLTSRYYATGRDFAVLDTDSKDVAEIERVFNLDFTAAAVTPTAADSLLWSPNLARAGLLKIIQGATSSLLVENEEMADPIITSALSARARAGVAVTVIMTNQRNTYAAAFDTLTAAGVKVYTYAYTAPLYIHAKVILADTGSSARKVYVGSINFSTASETRNRELGTILSSPALLNAIKRTLTSDIRGPRFGYKARSSLRPNAANASTVPRLPSFAIPHRQAASLRRMVRLTMQCSLVPRGSSLFAGKPNDDRSRRRSDRDLSIFRSRTEPSPTSHQTLDAQRPTQTLRV